MSQVKKKPKKFNFIILISKKLCMKSLASLWQLFDTDSRLKSERLPIIILKFICGKDKKLVVIEIVSDNATFSEVSLRRCQISKMALFTKIVIGFRSLNVFSKKPNLEVWQETKRAFRFYKSLMLVPITPCKHRWFSYNY